MKHFLMMVVFAALVGTVFGTVGRERRGESFIYGLKIFGEFLVIGLLLAWLLYWFPF